MAEELEVIERSRALGQQPIDRALDTRVQTRMAETPAEPGAAGGGRPDPDLPAPVQRAAHRTPRSVGMHVSEPATSEPAPPAGPRPMTTSAPSVTRGTASTTTTTSTTPADTPTTTTPGSTTTSAPAGPGTAQPTAIRPSAPSTSVPPTPTSEPEPG